MKNNLERAKEYLISGQYTCVLCKGDMVYTSTQRGIKPLVEWISDNYDMKGFSASDRIVGKAAALLYVIMEVKSVYANVMTESACDILERNGIEVSYDISVKSILNRAGNGLCPMEQTVMDIDEPKAAFSALAAKLKEMAILNGSC